MIYLINFAHDGKNIVSARCRTEEEANTLTKSLAECDIYMFRVGWFCYWLQKHSFYKLAIVIASMTNS